MGRVDVSVIVLLQAISSQTQTIKGDGAVKTHPTAREVFTPKKTLRIKLFAVWTENTTMQIVNKMLH